MLKFRTLSVICLPLSFLPLALSASEFPPQNSDEPRGDPTTGKGTIGLVCTDASGSYTWDKASGNDAFKKCMSETIGPSIEPITQPVQQSDSYCLDWLRVHVLNAFLKR